MQRTSATCSALLPGIALAASGCVGDRVEQSAAQTEAVVTRNARAAITVAAKALGGSAAVADAGWHDCVPNMAWSYRGGGTFHASHGDVDARLAKLRSGLVAAGYADTTQVDGQVAVERQGVTFVINPQRIGMQPERWSFSYRSRCLSYPAADAARVKDDGRRDILKD